jgi:PhoPQ-activated pathogenicity-related protein
MSRFSALPLVLMTLVAGILTGCPDETPRVPVASFTAAPVTGAPPLNVNFNDTSTGNGFEILDYRWSFGDGGTSNAPNPSHQYLQPGTYSVSLRVTTANGSDTLVREGLVKVESATRFDSLDEDGGSIELQGITVAVPANALTEETVYGVRAADGFVLNAPEPLTIVSTPRRMTHNNESPEVYASVLGNAVQPASIEIPFETAVVPEADRTAEKLMIVVQMPDGLTLPLPVTVLGDSVRAELIRIPEEATYAVVYRPQAETTELNIATAKAPTGFVWQNAWQICQSNEMLQQLSALRTGNIFDPASFNRRGYNELALNITETEMRTAINNIVGPLSTSDLRRPRLIERDGAYKLILFNLQNTYSSSFAAFRDITYMSTYFGHVVVDPRQLLAVSARNANLLAADRDSQDVAQIFTLANAFTTAVFEASFDGYEYADITTSVNGEAVSYLAGLEQGLETFLGQIFASRQTSRTFDPGERALLSEPLLAPFSAEVPGYAPAGQDFFRYVQNAIVGSGDLSHNTESSPPVRGILDQVRFDTAALLASPVPVTFERALGQAALSIDASMQALLGVGLGEAYAEFAQDVGYENSDDAVLRPSDEARAMNTLSTGAFAPSAVIEERFVTPTDMIEISANDVPSLAGVPPLTSRAIVLSVHPLTTEVTLTFNMDEWVEDARGNSMIVAAYGPDGTKYVPDAETMSVVIEGFMQDPEDCFEEVTIIASNTNLETPNSFAVNASAFAGLDMDEEEVLQAYVDVCNPDYSYEVINTGTVSGFNVTSTVINMTSGAWRGPNDVDRVMWEHSLTIVEPPRVTSDRALLLITGGSTTSTPGSGASLLVPFALATGSVVAQLQTVPNQPLVFSDETRTRVEDAIIAYSFDEYMKGFDAGMPDKTWPALLPMTRAAVLAMDTIQDVMGSGGAPVQVNRFVVTGASKRGWTTWLTAAVDDRVEAIMPMVIDVLNMEAQIAHHEMAYGTFSTALQDYVDEAIFDRFGTDQSASLLSIVDPYTYRDRLTMPKYIANATGDQFFLPDSSQFYLDDIPGENTLYYAPNVDHGLGGGSGALGVDTMTFNGLLTYYTATVRNFPIPKIQYKDEGVNGIRAWTTTPPKSVKLWQATNPSGRDFRIETINAGWTSMELDPLDCSVPGNCDLQVGNEGGEFLGQVAAPEAGWRAFYIQFTFPGPDPTLDADFTMSTPVRVVPDTYPVFP